MDEWKKVKTVTVRLAITVPIAANAALANVNSNVAPPVPVAAVSTATRWRQREPNVTPPTMNVTSLTIATAFQVIVRRVLSITVKVISAVIQVTYFAGTADAVRSVPTTATNGANAFGMKPSMTINVTAILALIHRHAKSQQ